MKRIARFHLSHAPSVQLLSNRDHDRPVLTVYHEDILGAAVAYSPIGWITPLRLNSELFDTGQGKYAGRSILLWEVFLEWRARHAWECTCDISKHIDVIGVIDESHVVSLSGVLGLFGSELHLEIG